AHDPEYVLVVSLDEPEDRSGREPRRTAGWTAAPVAGEIIRRSAPLMNLRPLPKETAPLPAPVRSSPPCGEVHGRNGLRAHRD
ncbi:MAG: hypothetical protein AAFV96_12400, partial [Pseudomonadota bacterium]